MNKALSILAGVIAGGITVFIVESIGHLIWPPPAGVDMTDPDQLATIMDTIPFAAKAAVVVAWGCGSFVGGFVASKISKDPGNVASLLTGGVLLLFGVMTMFAFPHPIWMMVAGVLLPIPCAYAGAQIAGPTPSSS